MLFNGIVFFIPFSARRDGEPSQAGHPGGQGRKLSHRQPHRGTHSPPKKVKNNFQTTICILTGPRSRARRHLRLALDGGAVPPLRSHQRQRPLQQEPHHIQVSVAGMIGSKRKVSKLPFYFLSSSFDVSNFICLNTWQSKCFFHENR